VAYRVTDAYEQHGDSTYAPTVQLPAAPVVTAKVSTGTAPDAQSAGLDLPADGTVTLLDALGQPTSDVAVLGEGTYVLDPSTATVTFTPVAGFDGPATPVAYRASDAYGQTSATATYTPTVTAPAPPPAPQRSSNGTGTEAQSEVLPVPVGGTVALLDGSGHPVDHLTTDHGVYDLDPVTGRVTFVPRDGYAGTPD